MSMKHSRVERSRSPTPIALPFDPDDPAQVEADLRVEKEAYEALVGDNGRPCYPIELGFEVFKHPGQYKDLFQYWDEESGVTEDTKRWIFTLQLERWKKFRQFQQKTRRYYVFHSRFAEFQQKVLERRRRHGLDGDVQLLEDRDKQSKMEDWMEYQDYELQEYERLEKNFKEAQAQLASRRKALAEAGVSAFEGVQELEFASYYSLVVKCGGEEAKAENEEKLAERKLRLAEKRLKAAESDDLGEMVERATWVRWFLKEVECAQMRLNKLQCLAENAKRDLEPFKRWLQARHNEWGEKRLEDPEEAKRTIRLEFESAEFRDRSKKLDELEEKSYEASSNRFRAEEEVEFAEEGYIAARLDNLGETIERAALIKVAQEEVRSAESQFEQAKVSTEKIELKRKVISALSSISCIKGKIKRHNVLVEWIEQQRREIASRCADTEKEGSQGLSKRASLRVLRHHSTTEALRPNKPPKANGRKRKLPTARSILSPVDPAKVSKAPSKKRSPHRKISGPRNTSQAAEKPTADSSIPESTSKQVFKVKDAMPTSLRPIHPSRISKPGGRRPTKLRRDGTLPPITGTRRLTREDNLGTLSTPSTGGKAMQQSGNVSLRRSTRQSKQRPGYT